MHLSVIHNNLNKKYIHIKKNIYMYIYIYIYLCLYGYNTVQKYVLVNMYSLDN